MNAIARIQQKLERFPQARVRATATSIRVEPSDPDGFAVRLDLARKVHVVSFEGWHEELADEAEAIRCFAFGLSDQCRLIVTYRGNMPTSWTVEWRREGSWHGVSTTGLLWVPFWRRRRVEHKRNRLLVEDAAAHP
jgi:hypothetical protein